MPVKPKAPVEIGQVRILTEGYWSIPDFVDQERCGQILKLVCERIKAQRNVVMDLQILRSTGSHKLILSGAASGDPPEILVRTYNDRSEERMPDPLRLNEAIEAYGPNLSKIPESCWELSKIGDDIISIPSVGVRYDAVAINKDVLDRYGWQIPVSPETLEQLLADAKAAGVRPIDGYSVDMFQDWFGIHIYNVNCAPFPLVKDKGGKLVSVFQSSEYSLYLSAMKNWADKGYLIIDSDQADDGNWLLRRMYSDTLAKTPGAVPIKPLAMTASEPAEVPPLQAEYCFEAYNKPEALVTLLDWTYENEENHTLIAKGEEGKDYRLIGTSGYEFIGKHKWEFQEYLSMDGFGSNRYVDCVNPEALKQGAADIEPYAIKYNPESLPLVSWRYALPKSNLWRAWDEQNQYTSTMAGASDQYIRGQIAKKDYDDILEESAPLIEGFIKLVNGYLAGSYDPTKEMYAPAPPPSAD